jgi:hypothetical protein
MKNLAAWVLNNVHSHRQPEQEFTVLLNQIYKKIFLNMSTSVAAGMFIPDPGSEFLPSRIPYLHQRI